MMTLFRTFPTVKISLTRFALATPLLMSLMACSQTPSVESKVVENSKVVEIQKTIAEKYPNADAELQHHILDVVVKAIDNMVFIEGGSYMMGDFGMPCSPDNIELVKWEKGKSNCVSFFGSVSSGAINLHKVTLSNYSLSKYETTYYDMNAYRLAHNLTLIDPEYNEIRLKRPTPTKNWQQAKDYCTWLGDLTGYPFDLPTEAQWEYAARDRGKYIYYATNDGQVRPVGGTYVVRDRNGDRVHKDWLPEEWNYPKTNNYSENIGTWPPNPLGIDALGHGATEWVNDWYSADYYQHSPELDPQGPATGTHKVQRGSQSGRPVVTKRFEGKNNRDRPYFRDGFRCSLQQTSTIQ